MNKKKINNNSLSVDIERRSGLLVSKNRNTDKGKKKNKQYKKTTTSPNKVMKTKKGKKC